MLVALCAIMSMDCSAPRSELLASRLKDVPRLGLGMASLGRPGYINLGHADDLPSGRSG